MPRNPKRMRPDPTYTKEQLDLAAERVISRHMTYRQAPKQFNFKIPKTVIVWCATNFDGPKLEPGCKPMLNVEEENGLEALIIAKSWLSYPFSRDEIKDSVKDDKFTCSIFSNSVDDLWRNRLPAMIICSGFEKTACFPIYKSKYPVLLFSKVHLKRWNTCHSSSEDSSACVTAITPISQDSQLPGSSPEFGPSTVQSFTSASQSVCLTPQPVCSTPQPVCSSHQFVCSATENFSSSTSKLSW
ncbi:hypothetical protein PR048_021229 [Dryococelus australis]|uniref:DDE-1 domain-containing protein n=1 Tax=Dryococelus australis TaxID=614101 RepID=A0ABQ9GXM4_9NEOP|nr:hypothetical protein PR048_021229 [Dryococelus australis]